MVTTDRERDALYVLAEISRRLKQREHMAALVLDVNSTMLKATVEAYDRLKRDQRAVRYMRRLLYVVLAVNFIPLVLNLASVVGAVNLAPPAFTLGRFLYWWLA